MKSILNLMAGASVVALAAFSPAYAYDAFHVGCASAALASCMQPASAEVVITPVEPQADWYGARRHAHKHPRHDYEGARGQETRPPVSNFDRPVSFQPRRDELYDDACNSSHAVFSCPGTGSN